MAAQLSEPGAQPPCSRAAEQKSEAIATLRLGDVRKKLEERSKDRGGAEGAVVAVGALLLRR